MDESGIHRDNPFSTPSERRSPVRRLRGRLVAPVTVWTAGTGTERAGLTVSSIMVADGEPPAILGLINDTSEFWDLLMSTERFVVHVLSAGDRVAAEEFAGLRPAPGGAFTSNPASESPFGPVIDAFSTRASCSLVEERPQGFHRLVIGEIRDLAAKGEEDPLTHFRGVLRPLGGGGR